MSLSKPKLAVLLLLVLGALGVGAALTRQALEAAPADPVAREKPAVPVARPGKDAREGAVAVRVVRPLPGGLDRTTQQPCTVHAFEHEDVYALVPGVLHNVTVDLGDRVKKGQVLAQIDSPLLRLEERQAAAALKLAEGKVEEAQAGVAAARAAVDAAKAAILQRQADVQSASATLRYRQQTYSRVQALVKQGSVDTKLLDEETERLRTAEGQVEAGRAAREGARADLAVRESKVAQALAALASARANVEAVGFPLERARLLLDHARVVSPFDGVVTQLNYRNGNYVRAGAGEPPLLTVVRTDRVRVVVQVPDPDVPYTEPGTPAEVTLDALPGAPLAGLKVARVAFAVDEKTRTMRAEIDVPNPTQQLRPGMVGAATLLLKKGSPDALRVPASALVMTRAGGGSAVYVVRGGKAHRTPVQVRNISREEAEVLSGLRPTDEVVVDPRGLTGDAVPVEVRQGPAPE